MTFNNYKITITRFTDGIAIHGDAGDPILRHHVLTEIGDDPRMIHTDPPYGNIIKALWDRRTETQDEFCKWMISWTAQWATVLNPGDAFYVWGGTGRPKFRPYFQYLSEIETAEIDIIISNYITWSKKRGIGTQYNYLYTREELAYMIKASSKAQKPRVFNVPLLDELRGYTGFNKKYKAKSDFKRRTNVWTDVTELLQGKKHPTEKRQRVVEIPIEVSSNPGDWVIDMFAGSGSTALAARKLGRRWVVIEADRDTYDAMVKRISVNDPSKCLISEDADNNGNEFSGISNGAGEASSTEGLVETGDLSTSTSV